jgi:hypothetical protein
MKITLCKVCSIAFLIVFAGCDALFQKEPETTIRAIATTGNELADTLQSVRDADSARAVIEKVDRQFSSLCNLMAKVPALIRDHPTMTTDASTAANLNKSMAVLRKGYPNAEITTLAARSRAVEP